MMFMYPTKLKKSIWVAEPQCTMIKNNFLFLGVGSERKIIITVLCGERTQFLNTNYRRKKEMNRTTEIWIGKLTTSTRPNFNKHPFLEKNHYEKEGKRNNNEKTSNSSSPLQPTLQGKSKYKIKK